MSDYNQIEINNINIVLKLIKQKLSFRIRSSEYDLFTTDQLVEYSNTALTRFNTVVPLSNITWEDTLVLNYISNDLAEVAVCLLILDALEIKFGGNNKTILRHTV